MNSLALEIDRARKVFTRERGPWLLRLGIKKGNGKRQKRQVIVAIDDVSLRVKRGEIFGVLGPNGSGKSTLIRLIATLLISDAGTIQIFGHDVRKDEYQVKQMINRVSVDAAFFKKLSPMENLIYAARLYGMQGHIARERIFSILGRLGVREDRVNRPMEHMSRGMQQKVAIARAFLTSPILLLLDEPTTGLDPRSKREVQRVILEVRRDHDATVLLTTHDMEEADRLCDRVAIIDEGRIIAEDTPEGLKALIQSRTNSHSPTLEDVFMELTGKTLEVDERKGRRE
ncbi:MAG: ABC transporter ATP-binding protein [Candidatus Bipolaricaulia bacterium]